MQPVQNRSKSKRIVILAAVVAVLVIVGGAAYAFMRVSTDKDTTQTQTTKSTSSNSQNGTTVTKQSLAQGMSDANESVKESQAAHKAAEQAFATASKRAKVSQ